MKLKFKAVMAFVTAVAMMMSVAVVLTMSAAAEESERGVQRDPTFCNRTGGFRVWDFSDNIGNEVGFNTLHHREEGIRGGRQGRDWPIHHYFNADFFQDVRGMQVQFFFDWDNTDWGETDEGESSWVGHSIAVVSHGIMDVPRGDSRSRDFFQTDFDFVEEITGDNQILIGDEEVIVTVGINPHRDTEWFRASITSWLATPGSALVHLIDEDGEVIRLICNDCDEVYCQCTCSSGCGKVYSECKCDLESVCETCNNIVVACVCVPDCGQCGNPVTACECVPAETTATSATSAPTVAQLKEAVDKAKTDLNKAKADLEAVKAAFVIFQADGEVPEAFAGKDAEAFAAAIATAESAVAGAQATLTAAEQALAAATATSGGNPPTGVAIVILPALAAGVATGLLRITKKRA
jgi:hypothetical protein